MAKNVIFNLSHFNKNGNAISVECIMYCEHHYTSMTNSANQGRFDQALAVTLNGPKITFSADTEAAFLHLENAANKELDVLCDD